ncbi:hypothetical protein Q3G72_027456 [Acer saccharum]|nr:hypothetical protein Q3G72_027456 [Acer saccharum]
MNSSAWTRERNEVVVWIREHKHIVFSNFGDVFCLTARYLVEEFPKAALSQDLSSFINSFKCVVVFAFNDGTVDRLISSGFSLSRL